MRRRGKRELAALLAVALLAGSAACGADAGEKDAATGAAEAAAGQDTETAAGQGTDAQAGAQENMEETALSLMREVNPAEAAGTDDLYRSWYEVFVYSFYDGDGDGIGDLPGLTEKLDYINDGNPATDTDLGCDGIWLMPVMPATTYHKYDVTDYCAIDEQYGTMEDFETFVNACHERGIRVMIDFVMNHTSSQHPWFQTAAEYLKDLPEGMEPDTEACPYVDYYHFSREKGSGYCQLAGTDWYYEAQFWSEMPDLNLESEAVRQEFDEITDFWLEKGVDGFRLDAAKEYETGSIDSNIEILSWFNNMVKEKKSDAYIVAEVWSDLETYAQYYQSGIDSSFDFTFADKDGVIAKAVKGTSGASSYGKAIVRLQDALGTYSDSYIDAPFYTNHDMGRGAGYYSGDTMEAQTKLAQAMNLLMSGSSFLYYGEELGMKGAGKDENKRAPMYWSKDAGAEGMCLGPQDMDEITMIYDSFAEQQDDGNSIYWYVKEALRLRNAYPEISHGTAEFLENLSDDAVCVLRKSWQDSSVIVVFNCTKDERTVDLSQIAADSESGDLKLAGELLTGTRAASWQDGTLTLPAYGAAILK